MCSWVGGRVWKTIFALGGNCSLNISNWYFFGEKYTLGGQGRHHKPCDRVNRPRGQSLINYAFLWELKSLSRKKTFRAVRRYKMGSKDFSNKTAHHIKSYVHNAFGHFMLYSRFLIGVHVRAGDSIYRSQIRSIWFFHRQFAAIFTIMILCGWVCKLIR